MQTALSERYEEVANRAFRLFASATTTAITRPEPCEKIRTWHDVLLHACVFQCCHIGIALKRCIKGADRPTRYESGAFAALLPNTPFAGATVAAEQVREHVSSGNLRGREIGTTYGKITLAIALARYEPGDIPYQLSERTEHALRESR